MKQIAKFIVITTTLFWSASALAQEMVIYPSQGQSNEQMEQDKFQCYSWSKNESGFDPMALPTTSAPPPAKEAQKGGVVKGAVRGTLVGGAVGKIAGNSKSDTRKGLKAGAATGALVGGMRRNSQVKSEEKKRNDWEQQQVNQYAQGRTNYNRAYAACMEGRGYSVK
ncbi:MAG: glycine zipper family protein [Desulfuromusa sp.]|nr:glycine zipper family protein [Desulfuromusa sp.]